MDYPDDFDTSAFPAGKRIAVSRTAGIWVMISFLVIIIICFALPWIQRLRTIEPFVIYVNGSHGFWELVGHQSVKQQEPYYKSIQRALAGTFTEKWFTLSDDATINAEHWGSCNRTTVCANRIENTLYNNIGCDLYCLMDDSLYQNFVKNIVPMYQTSASFGERWYVNPTKIYARPNGDITETQGSWVVQAHVRSTINGEFDVIAYVQIGYNIELYPQTLGYYVSGFNAYREQ